MMMLFLSALLLLVLVAGVGLLRDRGGKGIARLREALEQTPGAREPAQPQGLGLLRDDLLSEIPALHRWLSQRSSSARLRAWLQQGGVAMRPGKYLLLLLAAGAAGGMLGMLVAPGGGALAGAAVGLWIPYAALARRRRRRLAKFSSAFPAALDLVVRASRAGHPPAASFELIASEMPEPLAGEFRQVFDQQQFGLSLRESLLGLAERVPTVDVRFFAIAVIVQRESGGNLAEILEKLAGVIRERMQLRRQVKVHTAQGRMSLWVLTALAPLLLLGLMSMSRSFVMPLFTDPLGRMMLAAAVLGQLTGWFLLQKIVRLEV